MESRCTNGTAANFTAQGFRAVWGPDYGDQVDYLRVFVKNLRKKMEPNPEEPRYITTEPWVGYRLKGSVESL